MLIGLNAACLFAVLHHTQTNLDNVTKRAMRFFICMLLMCTVLIVSAQPGGGNKKPKIVRQAEISTNEETPVIILFSHLQVEDRDDWWYPWGFTMRLYPGDNYTFEGFTVTPAPNFFGKLKVPVTVNDGEDDSDKFDLEITVNPVNDKPVVTGHVSLTTDESKAITLSLSQLSVNDPDDNYPSDFTLKVFAGENYSVNGNTITPQTSFIGTLSVNVVVNDGQIDSDVYKLPVQVKPVNRVPQITGQAPLSINEDEAITIQLSHLIVVDGDNNYPQGFTLNVTQGSNYNVSGNTITPLPNFFGKINAGVTVNDGTNTSAVFNLVIIVNPVNDLPKIVNLETTPLSYQMADIAVALSTTLNIEDADGDSIVLAEVGIRPEGYEAGYDELIFKPIANGKIRGSFDSNTGVLSLFGIASPKSYASALRSIQFNAKPREDQSKQSKTVYLSVNDGKTSSDVLERRLTIGKTQATDLDIPTGFTPNGDFANDTWKIRALKSSDDYAKAMVKVYSNRGKLVYESIGFEKEWDGRFNGELLPAGTYYYTIDIGPFNNKTFLKGIITILR